MKKIAIPAAKNLLSTHFGHCEEFHLYEVDHGMMVRKTLVPAPPHEPGMLPEWLRHHHVTEVIAGGMGHRALNQFNQQNINVLAGAPMMPPDEIIRKFLSGNLQLTGNRCNHSSHHSDEVRHEHHFRKK